MDKKRILILLMLISFLLAVPTISAIDADDLNETAASFETDIVDMSSESIVLGEGEGSFSDLQNLIDANSEITLDKNYKYDASKDSDLKDGIKLNKTITISGNNIYSIDGDNQARIFDITGSNIVLRDIKLINANSEGNGGAIAITSGSGTLIDNVAISNSRSNGDGGAIYLSGTATAVRLKDIKIDHSSADGYGGGIYTDTPVNSWDDLVDFNSITITYSSAVYGGAFFLNSLASANNFEFNHNTATEKGGAIYFNASYPPNMEGYLYNSIFINNTAKYGGALYLYGDNGAFKNITLVNNTATGNIDSSGGAISVIGTNWKIVDGYAINNTAVGDGGAVYWSGNTGLIDNMTFIRNTASYIGGGVYFEGTEHTTVQNSTFSYNVAGTNGGALDWSTGSNYCTLINSTFTCNSAARSGGAIYIRGDYVSVYDSRFKLNMANGTTNADDRNPNKYTTLGGNGGAIIYIGSYGHVENSSFIENDAYKSGGAIYLQRNTNTTFLNSIFINNTAGAGGGAIELYERASYARIIDSLFINNTAGTDGGAVNFATGSSNAIIFNSTFDYNTAKRNGGALCWEGTEGNVSYCNFSYNKATGESLQYDMTLTMDNIFVVYALPEASQTTKNRLYILDKSVSENNITFESYVTVQDGDEFSWLMLERTNIVNDTAPSAQDWGIDRFFGGDGGAILWSGNVATIDHCIFIGSESARRGGGAYMTGGDNVTFSNCHFENGTSGTNGGGVDWLAGANYGKLINCTFIHNNATRSAGAIYYDGDYGEFVNVTIIDNHAHGNMDEMKSLNGVDFAGWDTSHWDTNTTGGDGGAIMLTGSHIIIYNVTFENNSAVGRGGAVFIQDNENVTFDLCSFENNIALGTAQNTYNDDKNVSSGINTLRTGLGGAIAFDTGSSYGTIKNSRFLNNTAARDGGAIDFAPGSSYSVIFNSTFENNVANRSGGAFYWDGSNGNVSYSNFTNNRALGTALQHDMDLDYEHIVVVNNTLPEASESTLNYLYILDNSISKDDIRYKSYVTVKNADDYEWLLLDEINIVNDDAPSPTDWGMDEFFGGDGGTILWGGNNGIIDHCIFVDSNSARRGGGAYMRGSDNITFSNSEFINCTSGTNGGALDWLAGANYGKVINSTFTGNRAARSAGTLYYDGNYGQFINITVKDSYAYGGSLDVSRDGSVDYAGWDSSHWDTNTTGGDAGAIMITGDHVYLYNATFINCTATGRGGAVFLQDNDNITFDLCKFANNTALGIANNTYNDDTDVGSGLNILHTGNGGAIGFDVGATNGVIKNSIFVNNTAYRNGGAISFYTGSVNATIFNSSFTNNTARRSGGALFWDGTNGNVSYCNFTSNRALGTALEYDMDLDYEHIVVVDVLPEASASTMDYLYIVDSSTSEDDIQYQSYVTVKDGDDYVWLLLDQTHIVNDDAPSPTDWGMDQFFGGNGGTILWGGDNAVIDHCIIVDSNSARRGGGAYMRGSDNITFSNSEFINSTSGTNGGALDWLAGANYGKVINSTFTGNHAARSAGTIYYDGNYGEFINITVRDSMSYGGSLDKSSDGLVVYAGWDSSHWDTNTTGGDAGAIMITGDHVSIYNATFVNCTSVGRGGAVFLQDNNDVLFDLCTFENNIALGTANNTYNDDKNLSSGRNILHTGNGGAIAFDSGATEGYIKNSYFFNNTAARNGGAISFYTGSSNATIFNSTFNNNTAYRSGGAFFWDGINGNVSYCNFSYNKALGTALEYDMVLTYDNIEIVYELPSQGVSNKLYIVDQSHDDATVYKSYVVDKDGSWLLLDQTEIVGSAPSAKDWGMDQFFGGNGGTILWGGDVGIIDNCNFWYSESARRGGGAYMRGSDNVTVSNSYFENCTSGTNGGGVDWLAGANYGKVINSTFNNTRAARSAGAIYYDGDYGEMTNITIINTKSYGGSLTESYDGKVNYAGWDSSHWDTNTTGGDAGAIMITGDHVYIYNATFTDCVSVGRGGAVFLQDNENVTIDSSTFTNNRALGIANNTWEDYESEHDESSPGTSIDEKLTGHGGAVAFDVGAKNCLIIDSEFIDNNARRDGGAVNFAVGALSNTIKNSIFTDNSVYDDGGAINWEGNEGLIYNITCYDNIGLGQDGSTSKGGTICITGSNVTITKSSFTLGRVFADADAKLDETDGGAIFVTGNNVNITDSTFDSCTSPNNAGGINIIGNNTLIGNCTFDECDAAEKGGAIFISGLNAKILNSKFKNSNVNHITGMGGSIYIVGNDATIVGSEFDSSSAFQGGVIYVEGNNCNVSNSSFSNSYAAKDGGAMYSTGSYSGVYYSNFTANEAEYDGGGIYWFGGKNSKYNSVIGCIFTDNIAYAKGVKTDARTTFGGGGLYWSEGGSYGTLRDSQFYNNSVRSNQKADGGAVLWDKSSHGIIDNCYFEGNYITTSNPNVDWVQGGALFLRAKSNFTISNCDFINSSSYSEAGAMYLSNTNPISPIDVLVVNTTFRDNVAESKGSHAYGGGAIQIKECYNVKLLNVTFINNTANQGGAVSVFETKGNTNYIENCTFIGNNATNRGGSIYAKNHFYIYNSLITDGNAGEYGGGIFTTGTMTYDKLIFINNTAKNGGGLYWNLDNVIIDNMEFINNTALNTGGAIYINNKNVTVSNVKLIGNKAVTGSAIYATYDITLINVYMIENQANSDSLKFKTYNTNTGKIEILFKGKDNYLNAIYMKGSNKPTCTNVTYWGAEGQANTGSNPIILSGAVNPTPEAGQNITVNVFDDNGKLLAKNYYLTDDDGTVSLDLHDVVPEISQALYKEIYVEAELTNDKYYTLIKLTSRIASEVTASANKTRYHSNSTVNVSVTDGATGKVSVYLNETFLGNITLSESKGSIDISTLIDGEYLQVGNYTLTFVYNGNAKYDVSNTTATLEITKTDSILLINATPKGYNLLINVTVVNGDWDTVSVNDVTGYVIITINHRDIIVDLVNGTGSGELYNLPKGQTMIEARYSGDSNYLESFNYTTAEITENVRTFIDVEVNAEDIMVDESIQINVTIISADNSVVNGNVTIFLDNTGYVIALNNSRASFNKTGLSAGYKLVAVIFEGNEDLAPSSGFGSFNVNKYDAFVKIDAKDIGYGTDEVINITVPDDAKGRVNVIIKGSEFNYEYGLEINNGTVLVPMSYFGIDEYNITVSFEDDRYKLTSNSSSFKVFDKSPSEITINVSDITIGDDLIVYVNVTENATGNVRLIIAGNTYTATLNNSKANFTVSNLIARNYHITAQYLGDINYFESTDEADFVVHKKNTPIGVSVTNSTVGSVEYINVTLDENATGYVLINIGGVHYYDMIENGTAQFNVTGLLIGNYTIEVTYMGSDYYSVNSTTAKLSISKIPVYINITSHDIIIDQDETLVIKTSENITALIKIEINNRNYTTFINEGEGSLVISGLKSGIYNVTVYYAGDDEYLPVSNVTNFTVKDKTKSEISVNVSDITIGEVMAISVNVTDGATGNVTVILAGDVYTVNLVDGAGSVEIPGLIARDYHVTAIYDGDGNFTSSQAEGSFKVNKKNTFITVEAQNITVGQIETITVNITEGTTGVVLININGIDYYINVTAGQYELNLDGLYVDEYDVNVNYVGDNYYASAANSTKFNVTKVTPEVTLEVTQGKIAAFGENVAIKLTGPSDVTGIANVYLTLDGVINPVPYTVYINNGVGYLTIEKPSVGKYNVSGVYLENYKYVSFDSNNDTFEVYMNGSSIDVHAQNIKVGDNETIRVTFPEGEFAGNVTIFVGETEYSAPIVFEGTVSTATLNVTGLASGLYIVTASFAFTNETAGTTIVYEGTTTFTVDKIASAMTIDSIEDIKVGDNLTIKLNLSPSDATGIIDVYVNGEKYTISNDNYTLVIPNLASAHYNVQAFYQGNNKYLASNASTAFNVVKNNIDISLNVSDIDVGNVEYINVTLVNDAEGYVLISVNDTRYYAEIIDGVAKVSISDIAVGSYVVTATFLGDDKYYSNSTTGQFTVSKLKTGIQIDGSNIIVGQDELLHFSTGDNLTVVVIIEVNGTNYTSFVREGKGNYTLYNLKEGEYTVKVFFNGDDKYDAVYNQTTFNVTGKLPSEVSINVTDITIGEDLVVYVNVTDGATGEVHLVIAGNTYAANLNDSKANFTVSNLIARNYHVTVQYNGDDRHYGSTNSTDFVVNKKNTAIEVAVTNSTVGSIEFVEVAVDANATGTILLSVNGSNYYEIIDNGVTRFNITGLLVGNYTASVTYIGDDKYNENSTEAKISISKKSTLINITGVDITIGAEEELAIRTSENITSLVTVKIGNDNYTTFISEGIGKLVVYGLSNGTYTATVYYKGDDEYIAVSNYTTFVVSDKKSSLIGLNVENITVGDDAIIEVNVTDGATGYVSLVIAGNTYRELLNDGKATFNVSDLIARDYHITVEYLGDDNYYGSENSANFTVNKKNSAIEVNVSDITVGESVELKINITNGTTGVVLIDINGTDYYSTIADGHAVLVVNNLIVGDYDVIVEYEGDANYNASSAKANFTVTKLPSEITITVSEGKLAAEGSNVVIDLAGMDDVTGITIVTVTSGDVVTNYTVYINNGVGSLIIQPAVGHYSVAATYLENHKYLSNTSNTDTFEVYDNGGDIGVITDNIDVGQTENITVIISGNLTGKATIHVNNETHEVILTYNETTNSSWAILPVEGLAAGEYAVSVEYNHTEGDKTVLYVGEGKFTVNKIPSQISINSIESIKVGENVTITFIISPDEATGNVTVYVNGVKHELNTGNLTLVIPGLAANQYHVQAFYEGDHKYLGSQDESSFEVVKNSMAIELNVTSIKVGDSEIINVTVNSDATGYVLINVSGTHYYAEINNGVATVTVNDLTAGTYDVNATFIEDDKYFTTSVADQFTVSRLETSIEISATDIVLGQDELLKFSISNNLTVVVTLEIDGNNYTSFVSEGNGNFTIVSPAVGSHTVRIYFNGNDKYEAESNQTSFVVIDKNTSEITVGVESITVGENATVKVNITPGATGNVTIVIRGNEYSKEVDGDGNAIFTLEGLTARDYVVTAIYDGDTYYAGSTAKANFTVNKIPSSIELDVADIIVGDIEIINITVTEGATGVVLINISGTCYYDELNDGKISFNVDGLKTGDYEVKVTYVGNDLFNESVASASFTVQPQITVDVGSNDGNSTQVTVKVSDNSTGEVTVIVNGTPYTADVVNGTAVVNVEAAPGEQNITVIYTGDGQSPIEQNKTVTIPKATGYEMSVNAPEIKLGENATVTVELPNDATGVVNLTVNNQTLTAEIKDGVATFNITGLDVGYYDVEVSYEGDDKYDSNANRTVIKVEINLPTINVVDSLTRGWNSIYDYEAVFTNEFGEVLVNTTVTYIIDGNSYNVVTEKGIAKLTTSHLAVGEYEVTSINPVTGEQVTKHLSIVPRLIENKDITMDFADGTYYVVLVIGDDGKPVGEGEIIDINVNSVHYVSKTDKKGYAKLQINLNPKTYKVVAEYKNYKVTNKLVIKQTLKLVKKTVKVKKTAKKLVLKAKLKWSNGKAIKGKKIVFKFKGKKYAAKTNSKGVAKVTIKKKVIKKLKKGKKYKYSASYISNTVKGKVKVK